MEEIRQALDEDRFPQYKKEKLEGFTRGQEGKMPPGKKGRRGRLTSL